MHSNGTLTPLDARYVYTLSLSIHFLKMMRYTNMDEKILCSLADLRNARRLLTPPPHPHLPRIQILSISCSFWGNLTTSCVAPPPKVWRTQHLGNPGSATDLMLALHLTKYFLIYTPIHFLFFAFYKSTHFKNSWCPRTNAGICTRCT